MRVIKKYNRILYYFEIIREDRAKVLYGGNHVIVSGHEHGYFIEPTIIEAETCMRITQEEVFGRICGNSNTQG